MANVSREEIAEGILKLADKLFRVLLPTVPRELLQIDVTMPQLKILFILFIDGAMRMSDLASDLQVTLATATGLVDRLVERGMVVRESQPDDRRVVICRLSDDGLQAVSGIWESARNNTRDLLMSVDSGQLEMLTEVLENILRAAEQTAAKQKR